jgi:uncharacterized membrane protein YvbJ
MHSFCMQHQVIRVCLPSGDRRHVPSRIIIIISSSIIIIIIIIIIVVVVRTPSATATPDSGRSATHDKKRVSGVQRLLCRHTPHETRPSGE